MLMAGFLINENLTWFFLIDAITTLLSLIPIMIFVKDTKPTKEQIESVPEHDTERGEKGSALRALLKRPILTVFTMIIVLFTVVYAQYTFGLPLFVNNIYGLNGPKIYGILMSVNAIMVVVFTLFIISITKKLPTLVSIAIGGFLYSLGFGVLFFTENIYLLILSTIIWTLGEIIISVNIEVFIANNSPITHRARFFALITFVQESGFALAPMLSGFYIASVGVSNIWPLVSLIAFIAATLMLGLFIWQRILNEKIKKSMPEKAPAD
jgi:MFS family permease